MANDYAYFMGDASRWEDATEAIWGSHNICPLLTQFQVLQITWLGLSTISQAEAWGDPKRPRFWYGLSSPSTSSRGGGREEVWPGGGRGPSQSNPSSLARTGGKEAHFTYQYERGLALCLHIGM